MKFVKSGVDEAIGNRMLGVRRDREISGKKIQEMRASSSNMNFNSTHVEQEGVSQIMQICLANARASDRVCSFLLPCPSPSCYCPKSASRDHL
jgi:hypothetical protein